MTQGRALPGGSPPAVRALEDHELAADLRAHLVATYGSRAHLVAALAASGPDLARRLLPTDGTTGGRQGAPALPFLRAEVVFAVRHDLALEVDDVLRRRLPIFHRAPLQGLPVVEDVADLMAAELGWSPARREHSIAAYRAAVGRSRAWQREA
jgi:glycerol-3-phosphate dehydrogenase